MDRHARNEIEGVSTKLRVGAGSEQSSQNYTVHPYDNTPRISLQMQEAKCDALARPSFRKWLEGARRMEPCN